MIWKEVLNAPILSGSSSATLNIYGSFLFSTAMNNQFNGKLIFKSSSKENTIYTANHFIFGDLVFDNSIGEWKLTDDIRTIGKASIIIESGSFLTNDKNIHCNSIVSVGDKKRKLLLGSSRISIRERWKIDRSTNLTFEAGTSEIILPKEKNATTFQSGNRNYNLIAASTFTCSPSGDGCDFFTITITTTQDSCNDGLPPYSGAATAIITGGTGPFSYDWTPTSQTTPTATGLNSNTYIVQVTDGSGNVCACSAPVTSPPSLVASTSSTPATCFGTCNGTTTVYSVAGGVSPYQYLWNPSSQTTTTATALCGNITYSVVIKDAYGCTVQKTKNVTQPTLLVSNGTSTSLACFNVCTGTASVNPSGGTSPYSYSWNGGATTSAQTSLCAGNYTCTVTDANGCTSTYSTTINQPTQLTATVTGTDLACNSICTGSVTVTASGGTGTYTYAWAPGGYTTSSCTGLCATTYSCTISDAHGCSLVKTITLSQPSAITIAPTTTNIPCFGQCIGSVTANAGGGVSPYTYSWSPGGCTTSSCSNLCAGTYSLNVSDNNGCFISGTANVTEPSLLSVSLAPIDVSCSGLCNGSVTATASGGTVPYTYTWSGGCSTSSCTGLCVGSYSVTVKDSQGCTATSSVTITAPLPLTANASSTAASCFGICDGKVTSAASGGTAPYTYSWLPGGCTTSTCSGLCAGNYTLTLRDAHGCSSTATATVSQPNVFIVSISSATPNPLNCNGDCNGTAATSVSGGTPLYTYAWSNGETTPSITGLCAGLYNVTVTDANGCPASTSVTFLQPSTLSVTIASSNPTCSNSCNGSISAVAGGGTPGYTYSWLPGGQSSTAISSLCAGDYTLTVTDTKGCSNTQTVTLTSPTAISANTVVLNNVSCSGLCDGSANAIPSGGTSPYTFLWEDGQTTAVATGFCAGTHTVTVTDINGCSDIDIISISQPSVLTSAVFSSTSSCSLCNGIGVVTTSGGTTPYSFLWSPGSQTTSTAVNLCVGVYTVNITDARGCTNIVTVNISPVVTLSISVSGTSVSCPGSCDGIANAAPFGGGFPYTYSWTTTPVQTVATATGLCAGNYTVSVADVNGCVSTNTLTFTNPPALSASMSSVPASCGVCNGTATAAPTGGTGAYTYTWSGFPVQTTTTATGLCAGNYSVTVADANNCTLTNTVSVGSVPAISNSASTTLSACGGSTGAICVTPSGGTPGYTYLWSPGSATTACLTGLAAGIYTVTITDAAGCSETFQNVINNTGAPSITVNSQINPTCNASCNGSISITASGGVPSYNYLWAPGSQTTTSVSSLCAGTYIIRVDDAQPCTTFSSIIITDPTQLSINPTITNVSCSGGNNGNICLSPSGGNAPYTYKWLPAGQTTSCLNALTAGTYSVVVTDAITCDDTVAIPVSSPATLSITIASTNVTCNGFNNGTATASVSGGTATYTYSWSTGALLPGVVGLSPGNYSLTVTDSKGCTATASVSIAEPAVLTTTVSSTNITCNSLCDGTTLLSPSGGTAAYSYSWLPGGETTSLISGLCVGNFVGTVTDLHGCTSTKTVSITQPAALSVTVTTTNASCSAGCDGSASLSTSGGTGAYTYVWSPGGYTTVSVTGLCTGSYSITVSDLNGCGNTQFISINSPAVLQTNITNTSPLCTSSCDGTASSSPIGGTGTYTYSWSTVPVQTTALATGLCAGTYTLTLSDANGCSVTQSTNVVAPTPLTQANGIAAATCLLCNGSITIIASGGTSPYSFFWNTGATTATITGLCAGVYLDTLIDANGCLSVDTMGLSNTTGPTITVTHTDVLCYGACDGTGAVTSATGDGPPWIYSWFPYTQTTSSITGLCPLQYFTTVTDTNGCKTVDPINVIQPAQLASNPSITNVTCFGICNGGIATSASGGTGAYTYLWNPGSQTTSSITGQCAGTYTLTLKDANNCVFTSTITIGQNTILTSSVTSTNDSCNLSCDGTASVLISGGTVPYTYLWSPTNLTTSAVTGLCAGTHTLTTTDAVGCQNISNAVIAQPLALNPGLTSTNPTCNGSCNGSLSASPSGGTPPYTYLWNPGGATTTSVTGLCAGNYTFTLSDTNRCSITTTVSITDPAILTCTSTATSASCNNLCDGNIDITPFGGTSAFTFTWSPGGQTTEDITGLCPGIDSVLITDANGCSLTYSVSVGVVTNVVSNAGNDTSYCVGGTATLCSNSTNASSLAWYNVTAGWTPLGVTNCISQSPAAGITNYALVATNGICSDTDYVSVTVNNYPVLVASNDTTICFGDSVTLCVNGAMAYQWYTLPAWTPLATGSCITVSPAAGTTSYGIIGSNGVCSDSDSVAVTVLSLPIAIAGNDTANCYGDSIVLCSSSLNTTSVAWYSIPAWTLIDTTACITVVPPAGINDYALIASNGICSDTDTVNVVIYPAVIVDAGVNVSVLSSTITQLNGTGNGTYVWAPATGLSNTTIANPTATLTVTTTYTLTVTDTSGCIGWDTVRITIIQVVVPNDGLSPNGDGINDIWEIPSIEFFPGALVEVYNRWGERLFSTTDYKNNKWDAKYNGKDLPVGTYYYVINLNSDLHKEPITGPITILR